MVGRELEIEFEITPRVRTGRIDDAEMSAVEEEAPGRESSHRLCDRDSPQRVEPLAPGRDEQRDIVRIGASSLKPAAPSACGPREVRSGRARANGGGAPRAQNDVGLRRPENSRRHHPTDCRDVSRRFEADEIDHGSGGRFQQSARAGGRSERRALASQIRQPAACPVAVQRVRSREECLEEHFRNQMAAESWHHRSGHEDEHQFGGLRGNRRCAFDSVDTFRRLFFRLAS